MRKNNKTTKRRTAGRRTTAFLANPRGGGNTVIPKAMPLPTTMTVALHYDDTSITRTNAGAQNFGWRYRMNGAFDPDPLLLTGALPGFQEYATLYVAYRVLKFKWQVTLMSDELFPMVAYAVPLNTDPGANPTNGLTLAANTKGMIQAVSAIGGPGARFRGSLDIANFFGLAGYNYDNDFNVQTNSNPLVTAGYLLIGGQTPAILTAAGVVARVRLTYTISFNRRRNLAA
jgi:hypothetical protein